MSSEQKDLVKKIFLTLLFIFLPALMTFAVSAYKEALNYMQSKNMISCNADEAYSFLQSKFPNLQIKPSFDSSTRQWKDGLDPEFACRVYRLISDHPEIKIISAYRSRATQAKLCGSSGKSRNCAPPGVSCHQYGLAIDTSHPHSRAKMQRILSGYKLHLAYSSIGHIQCVEHQRASVNDKGGRKGCNFPCSGSGFLVDANGSFNPNEIKNFNSFNDKLAQSLFGSGSGDSGPSESFYGELGSSELRALPDESGYTYEFDGGESNFEDYSGQVIDDTFDYGLDGAYSDSADDERLSDTKIHPGTNSPINRPLPDYIRINPDKNKSEAHEPNKDDATSKNKKSGDNSFSLRQKADFNTYESPLTKYFIIPESQNPVYFFSPQKTDLNQDLIYNKNIKKINFADSGSAGYVKKPGNYNESKGLERNFWRGVKEYSSWVIDAVSSAIVPGLSAFYIFGI